MPDPQRLVLTNQFGEESINVVLGSYIPLPGATSIILMNGATAPVNGTTGDNIAGKGSLYIAQDTGALYIQTGAITNPVWSIVEAGNASVIGALLTGFAASAGTVSATDSILVAFNKLVGNTQNLTVIGNLLTGFAAAGGTVSATDSVLGALQKLAGNVAAHQANSVAADTAAMVVDFNALLAKLQTAKLMALS